MSSFEYSKDNFKSIVISKNLNKSDFDQLLISKWNSAMEQKMFKYDLDGVKIRVLKGRFTYMLQFNDKRFSEKRPGEVMNTLNMPFNEAKFNFKKIQKSEILFNLNKKNETNTNDTDTFVIINNSPIDLGHILLVPDLNSGKNQILDRNGIEKAIEILLLSNSFGFIVGFNSLCALASVNHLHFHAYYSDFEFPIQTIKGRRLSNRLWIIDEYLLIAYALQLTDFENNYEEFAQNAFLIADYFSKNEIAHNLVLVKGSNFDPNSENEYTIRVVFYPRQPFYGSKESNVQFHLALCELSGHIIIKDENYFNNVTETDIQNEIDKIKFDTQKYEIIQEDLLKLIV